MQRPAAALTAILVFSLTAPLFAQPGATPAAKPAPRKARVLAPGVITRIPVMPEKKETFTGPVELHEVTSIPGIAFSPNHNALTSTAAVKAKSVVLRRTIWTLEIAFKPLRMVRVNVPQPSGLVEKKLVWYLVYKVVNRGGHLQPVTRVDTTTGLEKVAPEPTNNLSGGVFGSEVRFFPHFVLEGNVLRPDANKNNAEKATYDHVAYLDRLLPAALPLIRKREDIGAPLHDSVSISRVPVPLSEKNLERPVWGVVTWEDVDPRMDYISIFVRGLTNAFQVQRAADGSYKYNHKVLQLNFWRPGDAVFEHEREVVFGVPSVSDPTQQRRINKMFGLTDRLDFRWLYR